jgi:FkbH-like protein
VSPAVPAPGVSPDSLIKDAWQRLRALRDAGRLIEAYPTVCGLIGDLDEEHRARAGRMLAAVDPEAISRAHPSMPTVAVAVTGNGTCTPLLAPLVAELARHRLVARTSTSGYGQYAIDLADPQGGFLVEPCDIAVCMLDADVVVAELRTVWTVEDCEHALRVVLDRFRGLVRHHHEAGTATLVLNTVPLPGWFARQLVDFRSRARLGIAWREFNCALLKLAEEVGRCVVVDLDTCLTDATPLDEPRLRVYAKVGFSEQLLGRLASEVGHVAKALHGRGKKLLVLDLDGTLWGGVLGDDGADGIEIGVAGRGEAFTQFQRSVAQLASQGVLLAVCSKNERAQVYGVLRHHPHMTLREHDFVAIAADWTPKGQRVIELARALNLDPDSVVFVDDSPFECGLVRHSAPGTGVVALDSEPARHRERLLASDWFATLRLTEEDYARRDSYRAETRRRDFRAGFTSLSDYLRGLDISVEMFRPVESELDRIAQLTQRTNQFNLTTTRLDTAELRAGWLDHDAVVWAIRTADRFGDAGIVGALFGREAGGSLVVENLLLSCRVFGRGIESACLRATLEYARDRGMARVVGHYRASAKNGRFADLYPRHGFTAAESGADLQRFVHDLATMPKPVEHIRMTSPLSGASPS